MTYEYEHRETGEERVVRHGMDEKPVVLTKDGKHLMTKKIHTSVLVGMDSWGRSKK
jgi:predicted nucleic acid-binding Zn ribbon protein